jgi:DNA polymerase-3 subunit delta
MPHIHVVSGSGAGARRLLAEVTAGLEAKGYGGVRRQEASDWGTLLAENSCRGLFEENSLVVVEEAEKLGPLPKKFVPMLEGSGASNYILLSCKSDNVSIIPREAAAKCSFSKNASPPPWARERDELIMGTVRSKGVGISKSAVMLMKELFEDMGELASESEKVASFCALLGRKEISPSAVGDYCLSDGSRSLLKFLDALCAAHGADSMEALSELVLHSELTPLLSALHNRFRLAMYFALYPAERTVFSRALGARDYAARQAETAAKRYGGERLKNFVTGLIRMTSNERSGQSAGWFDLEVLVIDLLSGAGVLKQDQKPGAAPSRRMSG